MAGESILDPRPLESIEGRIPDLSNVQIGDLRSLEGLEPYAEQAVEEVVADPDNGIIAD